MKTTFFYLIITTILSFCLFSCGEDNANDNQENEGKGFVRFRQNPFFSDDSVKFAATIQYLPTGEATNIEYAIYDGNTIIKEGSVFTDKADAGLNHIFESSIVSEYIPQATHAGKTLLVWLDPNNKKTAPSYTTEELTDLWKKETFEVPN